VVAGEWVSAWWWRAWRAYAIAGLGVSALFAGIASAVVSAAALSTVWFFAALAYGLQLLAFGGLLVVREQAQWFLLGWLSGMALRFGALGGVAWWLSRSAAFPRQAALLSLAGCVFLLVLLEPLFLRWDKRGS
jgi:hypothetical protein